PLAAGAVPPFPAFAAHVHGPDAVNAFTEAMDWEPLMEEPIAAIEALFAEAADLEEARDRLPGLLSTLPTERFRRSIAHAGFEAQAAGREGLALSDETDG